MTNQLLNLKNVILVTFVVLLLMLQSCAPENGQAQKATEKKETATANTVTTPEEKSDAPDSTEKPSTDSVAKEPAPEQLVVSASGKEIAVTQELLDLEAKYTETLAPVTSLKASQPHTYWFIVSWLNTSYKTPDWKEYTPENYEAWRVATKDIEAREAGNQTRGIDCSGFSRVMLDRVFDKKVAGSSRMLLETYSTKIDRADASMGDLVFFQAPNSSTGRIIHVGVYLMDDYFVHATSTRSAKKGEGLGVNSLKENRWGPNLVAIGRVKG